VTVPTEQDFAEVANELGALSQRVGSWTAQSVPPEPVPEAMLFGTSAPKGIDNLETQIGVRFAAHRTFDGGHPADFAHHDANVSKGKRFCVVSCKWSPWSDLNGMATWLGGFADSWPDDTDGVFILNHEPEDNGQPPAYQDLQRRAGEVWRDHTDRIPFGGCWQAYTANPASGRNPEDWWPGDGVWEFLSFDGYDKQGKGTYPASIFDGALKFTERHGIPFAIAEYGTKLDSTKSRFTQEGADLVAERGGPFCTYWNSTGTGVDYPWKAEHYPTVRDVALTYGGSVLTVGGTVAAEAAEQDDEPDDDGE